ncbi:MAG: hypothetical protein HUU45_14860, partial [Leptospiraceae bacterium]|nr:hypothetical protein [Leptospiraceae bacterium]
MPEVRTIIFMAFLFYVFTGAIFFIIDFDKKRSSAVYWGSAMLTLALGVLLI